MSIFEFPARPAGAGEEYDRDFYSWTLRQAALLRERRFGELDLAHIAEELETLGRSEFRAFASAFRVVLLHMLKWDHQPEHRSRSWWTSIAMQREAIRDILADNPGLKPRMDEAIMRGYRDARLMAADETGLPLEKFPPTCPYDAEAILSRPFERA